MNAPSAGTEGVPVAATPLGVSGSIAKRFQLHSLTPLLGLILFLLGTFAALITPREEEPQIDVTMANVMIPFPGASSGDVERLVAIPAEQVLSQIRGLEHVFTTSRPGMALVTLQYKVGVPRTEALVRLQDTLDANRDWLPRELGVGEPIVKPKGIDDVPVLAITLWAKDARPAESLERVALSIENELKRVAGVREVRTIGGPGRAVQVRFDAERLRASNLGVDQLIARLRSANASQQAGEVLEDGLALTVRTGAFLESAEDVASLIVGTRQGLPIYLRDVADIEEAPNRASRFVWHVPHAGEPYPAVTVSATKKAGENAVDVARALRVRFEQLRNTVVPPDLEATISRDYGQTAHEKASKLIGKLAFATLSVIVLVALALGFREAVIVGAAVVLTLAATLFASWAWGFTLNRVSLFALILSIGILVDDAIVVVENIHRHRALEPGRPLRELVPIAVDEVGGPTILATFTVIAALLPMAFVTGLMGPYMSPIPINSSMGMLLSLAIAFTVTPWLAHKLLRGGSGATGEAHGVQAHANADTNPDADAHAHAPGRLTRWMQRTFAGLLAPFIDGQTPRATPRRARARRWLLGLVVLAGVAGSVALVPLQAVVLKMLPFDNKSEFEVIVDMPPGTPVETTNAALSDMALALVDLPEVENVQGYAGTAAPINFNGLVRQYDLRSAPEQGGLQVNLVGKDRRHEQSHPIAQRLIAPMQAIADRFNARVKVVEVPPGPPVMSPLVLEVYGPDREGRDALAKRLESMLHEVPGLVAIDSTVQPGATELRVEPERAKAAMLGVADGAIVEAAQAALNGIDATWIREVATRRAVPVRLAPPLAERDRLDVLLTMPVSAGGSGTGAGGAQVVPLGELVRLSTAPRDEPRHRKDLLPVSYVYGDLAAVDGSHVDSPLYGLIALRGKLAAAALPDTGPLGEYFIAQPEDPYREYAIKWDGEWQITYETFRDMGIAYAVGMVLIYLLVVAQFRSYLTPLIIMAPIPLTIVGVMPGHALLGAQFTATSMIGMIALAGIIVRNSILLVDFIELETARGVPLGEAVVRSAAVRAQPILLTALAAMIGAFFILDDPIFNGLAISLIFGILVSTLLTLLVIPVLYYIAFRRRAPAAPVSASSASPDIPVDPSPTGASS